MPRAKTAPTTAAPAKKVTKPETPKTPKVAKPAAPAPEKTTETAEVDPIDTLTASFSSFSAQIQSLQQTLAALKKEFATLEKSSVRTLKQAQRDGAKRKRKAGNRQPSGFVKPTLISNELAAFLKKPVGTEMARTEVTREINAYIRSNNLQDKANGRKINPDKHLTKLLKIKSDEELTYFNLQRYMSSHFKKTAPAK